MFEYVIQHKTIRTPGRYILRGRFDTEDSARSWALDNRDSYGIIHAEVWRFNLKPNGKLSNPKMLAELY